MQKDEITTSASPTTHSRRLLWFTALVVAGSGLPALAVKPGNKGIRSTASVTISLEVHPSVNARLIDLLNPTSTSDSTPESAPESNDAFNESASYLCLDVRDTRTLTFFVVTPDSDGAAILPVAKWSFADDPVSSHIDTSRCPVPVSLNLSRFAPTGNDHVTLLVSPE